MPRVHDVRQQPEPRTPRQRERSHRILRAAAALGAEHGLEQVQMGDVAAQAEVAIGTLYRYFPSKHHLFAGLLAAQIEHITARPAATSSSAAEAVAEVMVRAVRGMLASVPLARAMIISINVVRSEYGSSPPFAFDQFILDVAALRRTSDEDRRLARLVEQCVYGILTWATAGEISPEQAAADVHRACALLLASWNRRTRAVDESNG